jgi:hypothetical protein
VNKGKKKGRGFNSPGPCDGPPYLVATQFTFGPVYRSVRFAAPLEDLRACP